MRPLKYIFTFIIVTTPVLAGAMGRNIECRNEARSPFTASLNINQDQATLKFGPESDGSDLEDDLASKSIKLTLNSESSNDGFLQFDGKTKFRGGANELRSAQVRVLAELLQSDSEFHMTFNISTRHSKDLPASSFWSYGMVCH